MANRTDPETPQFATFLPWSLRVAIAVVFCVVMIVALSSVPEEPRFLWRGIVFGAGFVAYGRLANRSVIVRLEEQAVCIQQDFRKVLIPYEEITEVSVGPRTAWWQIGRRRLADGSTGYLMGGSSVRITTAEKSVVISAEESYRVAGAIQRQREHAAGARDAEHTGR